MYDIPRIWVHIVVIPYWHPSHDRVAIRFLARTPRCCPILTDLSVFVIHLMATQTKSAFPC